MYNLFIERGADLAAYAKEMTEVIKQLAEPAEAKAAKNREAKPNSSCSECGWHWSLNDSCQRKPFDEIMDLVKIARKFWCGLRYLRRVCLTAERKRWRSCNRARHGPQAGGQAAGAGSITLERQCDREYLEKLDGMVDQYDALISMACGVGIQFLAERFPNKPGSGVDTCGLASIRTSAGMKSAAAPAGAACWVSPAHLPGHMCAKGSTTDPAAEPTKQLRNQCGSALRLAHDL